MLRGRILLIVLFVFFSISIVGFSNPVSECSAHLWGDLRYPCLSIKQGVGMYLDKESVQVVMYNPPEYRIKFNIILTDHQGEPDEYVTANNERYYKYMLDKDSGTALMYASSDSDYTDVMLLDYKNHSTQNYSYVVSGEAAFFKCYHMRFYGSYPDSMFADEFYNDFW